MHPIHSGQKKYTNAKSCINCYVMIIMFLVVDVGTGSRHVYLMIQTYEIF